MYHVSVYIFIINFYTDKITRLFHTNKIMNLFHFPPTRMVFDTADFHSLFMIRTFPVLMFLYVKVR